MIPILFSEEDRLGGDDILQNIINNGVVIAQASQINKNSVPRGVAKIGNHYHILNGHMLTQLKVKQTNGVGVINTIVEIDGVVRRIPLIMRIGEETYPTKVEVIRVANNPSYQVKLVMGVQTIRVPFSNYQYRPNSEYGYLE